MGPRAGWIPYWVYDNIFCEVWIENTESCLSAGLSNGGPVDKF
jgi:hypothetical protein